MNVKLCTRRIAAALSLAAATAAVLPVGGAQAQWYSSVPSQPPPLYPYAVQPSYPVNTNRPYAVEVAPGTYVIKRPGEVRAEPRKRYRRVTPKAPSRARRAFKNDPALIEELRKRPKVKRAVVNTTKIVHKKPIIRETTRYVDDPPRVIERYHVVDDSKPASRRKQRVAERDATGKRTGKSNDKRASKHAEKQGGPIGDGEKRVIAADAEITILGPDRMTIQLFRKGDGSKANARAE